MQISIVIPTYNRPKKLKETLGSILIQTILPIDVIVVDDSDTYETKELIVECQYKFKYKDIFLLYIHKICPKSAAISRNIGANKARGDIILFLDDDLILDKNYIKEILKVYYIKNDAIGVQGYITNFIIMSIIENIYNKLFFLVQYKKNNNRLLPSFKNAYAIPLTKIIKCQYMIGGNSSYIKKMFLKFKYDNNLLKYSLGEDVDLSYRIFKKYKKGLYQTPYAKLIHNQNNKIEYHKIIIYMAQIYHTYLFYKNIDKSIKNILIFIWSRIGLFIKFLIILFIKPSKLKLLNIFYLSGAYLMCIKNLKNFINGDLKFFNKSIKNI